MCLGRLKNTPISGEVRPWESPALTAEWCTARGVSRTETDPAGWPRDTRDTKQNPDSARASLRPHEALPPRPITSPFLSLLFSAQRWGPAYHRGQTQIKSIHGLLSRVTAFG
jgi:hypothetical protein